MKISVTKEDIEQGRPQDPHGCPVSRAVNRAGLVDFCVMGKAVVLADNRQRATALLLPDTVQQWIADYDKKKPVGPISFELGLPVPAAGCQCFKGSKRPHCPESAKRKDGAQTRCPLQKT